jgi:hypothetical protein
VTEISLADEVRSHFERHEKLHHSDHSDTDYNVLIKDFKVQMVAIPASNLLQDARVFSPEPYFIWDILRVTIQGFSGGTVTLYQQSTQADELVVFSNAGSYWFNPHTVITHGPTDMPVFQSASLTGTAYVTVSGLSVHQSIWGRYLLAGG